MNVKCKLSDREDNASSQREPVPSSHLDLFQLRFLSQMQDLPQLDVGPWAEELLRTGQKWL